MLKIPQQQVAHAPLAVITMKVPTNHNAWRRVNDLPSTNARSAPVLVRDANRDKSMFFNLILLVTITDEAMQLFNPTKQK